MNQIKEILEKHGKKISNLEKRVDKLEKGGKTLKAKSVSTDYAGLTGGIHLLIKNKFFSSPKMLNEVIAELKREGYHYGLGPVAKALSVYFMKKKKLLTRFKEGKNYKYVIRK